MKKNIKKTVVFWLLIVGSLVMFSGSFDKMLGIGEKQKELTYTELIEKVKSKDVKEVLIRNGAARLYGAFDDGTIFMSVVPNDPKMIETMVDNDVNVRVDSGDSGWGFVLSQIIPWLPMIILLVIMFFVSRGASGKNGGGGPLSIGKAKSKMLQEKKVDVTFNDVAGIDEAKAELEEIVDFLKSPKKFQRLGGKIPRGVLLVGAPGNGKTLLARAIAGEASVPFFSISGSDFVEVFVGVGASRVRDMFEHAKKNAPCIVFIDEIDAVGRRRDTGMRGGNDEREQTLNQLLVEMDGFDANQGVIVLAATNRSDILDPALLRPGRFDRRIVVQYPDMGGREKILKVHAKNVPLAADVDLKVIAQGTPGFSGAELANLVNEAALLAARTNKLAVTMSDFEAAKDKVLMGAERKSMAMSKEEKELTAYHESGHALAAYLLKDSTDPIHKVTIIPRGEALGMVMRLPEKDKLSVTRKQLLSDIKVSMAGRIAEEIVFGDENITTGASSDIKHATNIAKNMVTKWGMSSNALGFRTFYDGDNYFDEESRVSDQTAVLIDKEVKQIIETSYSEIKKLISDNKDLLDTLSKELLKHETLTGDQVATVLQGGKITKPRKKKELNFELGGIPNSD